MSHYEYTTIIGRRTNTPLTNEILSNTSVVYPTGEQCRIVSTSIEDSSAGTGAQKVIIQYFTSSWEYKSEIVTMDGTTPVDTVEIDIYRIQRFMVIKVGSNKSAVGTITLKSIDGTNLFAQIDSGENSFKRALYYIRKGYRCQIKGIVLCCSTSGGVEFSVFGNTDYTLIGGNIVSHRSIPIRLINNTFSVNQDFLQIIDAVDASQPLVIFVCAKGMVADQEASAHLYVEEFHVKDV